MFITRIAHIIECALRDQYDRFGQEIDPVTYFGCTGGWGAIVIAVERFSYDDANSATYFDVHEVEVEPF